MQPLLSSEQMREADQYTIDRLQVPALILMEHAALAVVRALESRFGNALAKSSGLVIAGSGNNGADALAVSRLLVEKGCTDIVISLLGTEPKSSSLLALQLKMLNRRGIAVMARVSAQAIAGADWIVDGIFGTGLTRAPQKVFKDAIEMVNTYAGKKWIVAIDVPSGLSADTGNPLGIAVKASETVTLGFMKKGLVTGLAADFVGRLSLAPIQIPRKIPKLMPSAFCYESGDATLPHRAASGHKGNYGHVFVWAGEEEKQGACILCATAALRMGAGLVSIGGTEPVLKTLRTRLPPEVMTKACNLDFFSQDPKGGVWVFGPGMGTEPEKWGVLEAALKGEFSLVLDADALTLLASNRKKAIALIKKRTPTATVLTPHPKEASILSEKTTEAIQSDRYLSCEALVEQWGCAIVLKGKGTLIGIPKRPTVVVTAGDTSLSKGGSGDTLSGLIAALLAQKLSPEHALPLACYIHGKSAERLSQRLGQSYSALASEIAAEVPEVLKEIAFTSR